MNLPVPFDAIGRETIKIKGYKDKGLFFEICLLYWDSECYITLAEITKYLPKKTAQDTIKKSAAVKYDDWDDSIKIVFLDDLYNNFVPKLTEAEQYEVFKSNFYADWDKSRSLKSTLEKYSKDPFVQKIYIEIKKHGLKKDDLEKKGPGDIIPGYKALVAKLCGVK